MSLFTSRQNRLPVTPTIRRFLRAISNYGSCDVILGTAQVGAQEVGFLMQSPPVNSSAYNASYIQGVAITNNCPFWDNYNPLSSWATITNLGWNADDLIHLNPAGQFFASRLFLQKLQWPALWSAAGFNYTNYVLTLPATSINSTSCSLNAFVNAHGMTTTNYFEYGSHHQLRRRDHACQRRHRDRKLQHRVVRHYALHGLLPIFNRSPSMRRGLLFRR